MHSHVKRRRTRLRATAITAVAAVLAFALLLGGGNTTRTEAATPKALINTYSVSGGASSQEALAATAAGFAVTVVSDATWASMTAADFGQYDVLIIGDPNCGAPIAPGLHSSRGAWGRVVLGHAGGRTAAGNRIVIGTDPVLHGATATNARGSIIRTGIAFAGLQPGRTGIYLDTSCSFHYGSMSQTLAILAAMSEGSGAWTNGPAPCGGSVSLIASHPSFTTLSTSSLQGWGCSVHEAFPTYPTDFSPLAVATDTATRPACGVDPGTGASACGQPYILISGSGIVVASGSISLSPLDATNPVDTNHTVTAHVTSGGAPLAGQVVTFTVTGQNAGAAGTCVPVGCTTDANGDVSFTYHGGLVAGDDTIKASFRDAAGSLQAATAAKHWIAPTIFPSVTTVTFGPGPFVYTGSAFTATSTVSPSGTATIAYSGDCTNVGTSCTATATFAGSPTLLPSSATASITITPAPSVVTIVGAGTFTYDASAHALTATLAGVGGLAASVPVTGCVAAPTNVADSCTGTAVYAGDANHTGSSATATLTINKAPSTTTVNGGGSFVYDGSGHPLTAVVTGVGGLNLPVPVTGCIASPTLPAHNCTGTATFAGDANHLGSTGSASVTITIPYVYPSGGVFVVGNLTPHGLLSPVDFWGAQWAKGNSLSGGATPSAFKGFENTVGAPACGSSWSTAPGNSSGPPSVVPTYMVVVVSSNITKSGSTITGNVVQVLVVKTNPGYGPNPGHAGTGTVLQVLCTAP